MEKPTNNDLSTSDFASLIRLLLEQQRGIRDLVEDVTKDIEELKHQMSDVLIIKTKIDVIDKEFDNEKRVRSDCQRNVDSKFTEIVQKRERINERISSLETTLNNSIFNQSKECANGLKELRNDLENKVNSKTRELIDSIKDIKDKEIKGMQDDLKTLSKSTSYEAGKYGGIVGLITAIILFLAKAFWEHIVKK